MIATSIALLTALLAAPPSVRAQPLWPDLTFEKPLWMLEAPDAAAFLVVEQAGRIHRVDPAGRKTLTVDLTDKVRSRDNEEGLLGMAIDPDFAANERVYLHYSASNPRRNVLASYRMTPDATRIDPRTEQVILQVGQPYGNHNGGMIAFGPDGYLYVSLGDGGSGGDPHNHGQRLDSLLGKVLRIDVRQPGRDRAYAIPPDNPFTATPGARPEIWAYGLRNVWRFSFDRATGELWAGDVGQNRFEEVNVITRGGNYGWRIEEGFSVFDARQTPQAPLIPPVHDYPRDRGVSVTGGYVYRGQAMPGLQGWYVFGDFGSGRIWALKREREQATVVPIGSVPLIASFAEDRAGELYGCSYDGRVYRLVLDQP